MIIKILSFLIGLTLIGLLIIVAVKNILEIIKKIKVKKEKEKEDKQ